MLETTIDAPHIEDLGVLHNGPQWVSLSRTQEAIVRALMDHFGRPVSRAAVMAATWPGGAPNPHAINVHIHRLRPQLRRLGLQIHTLRGRGFMLETDSQPPGAEAVPGTAQLPNASSGEATSEETTWPIS